MSKLSFYIDLVQYLNDRSVFDFFSSLLDPEKTDAAIQAKLSEDNFINKVLKELSDFVKLFEGESTPSISYDTIFKICNIFKLFTLIGQKPADGDPESILFESLFTNEVISSLFLGSLQISKLLQFPNILNAQLQTLYSLIRDPMNSNLLAAFTSRLGTLLPLLNLQNKAFYPYHKYVIMIFSELTKYSEAVQFQIENKIGLLLVKILETVPKHTISQNSILEYIDSAILVENLGHEVVAPFTAFLSKIYKDSPIEIRSFGWQLYIKLKEKESLTLWINEEIGKCGPFAAVADEIENLSKTEYGGKVPDPPDASSMFSASFTPEQLMALYQLLS